MAAQPVFHLDIEDMHIEVVLDNGFWNTFALAADMHAHTYYEVMLCPEGNLNIALSDGTVLALEPGSLCLIPPRVYHRSLGDTDTRKLAIRFLCTRNLKPGRMYGTCFASLERKTAPVSLGVQPALNAIVRDLCAELQQPTLATDACVQSLLSLLLVGIFRKLCQDDGIVAPSALPPQVSDRRLAIEEFFNTSFHLPITEEALASQVHLSTRQLNRVLRQLYGMSFRQLVIDIRMSRAVHLLCDTDLSIAEVAYKVGYTSVSGFYEAFQKHYGIPPGSYKTHRHE
ncbi:MAG: helix-turn-helix transcriptional regulator [Oscillospiraceae bacterium]|nr:helix-turn-helix transcriptional regulator [Oscillospiraceae bacterium]